MIDSGGQQGRNGQLELIHGHTGLSEAFAD